jgi:hypothetical protein
LTIRQHRFCGQIVPQEHSATYYRNDQTAAALGIILRAALSCMLPLNHGLLLHSAGAVLREKAAAFYGLSGAGKSTLSALSPFPLLSDELIAISRTDSGYAASATAFWGTHKSVAANGSHELSALFRLHKGRETEIRQISSDDAFRSLLTVSVVPLGAPLWSNVLLTLRDLVRTVPVYDLTWSPEQSPWSEISEFINASS